MAKEEITTVDGIVIQPAEDYRSGVPIKYVATEKVYVDGVVYADGETFVTDAKPGKTWKRITPAEKATIEASQEQHGDVDYSKLNVSELKATAAALGLDIGGATTKEQLITLIKARDIPQL